MYPTIDTRHAAVLTYNCVTQASSPFKTPLDFVMLISRAFRKLQGGSHGRFDHPSGAALIFVSCCFNVCGLELLFRRAGLRQQGPRALPGFLAFGSEPLMFLGVIVRGRDVNNHRKRRHIFTCVACKKKSYNLREYLYIYIYKAMTMTPGSSL